MVFAGFFSQNNLITPAAVPVIWTFSNVAYVSDTARLTLTTRNNILAGITVKDDLSKIVYLDNDTFAEVTPLGTNGDFNGTETGTETYAWGSVTSNGRLTDLHSNNGTNVIFSVFLNATASLNRIYRGVWTTPWDSSTLSSLEYNRVNSDRPQGIWFNEDYIYVTEGTEIRIWNQTSMTWDNSDISGTEDQYLDVSGTYSGEEYDSIMVDPTGTKIFVVDSSPADPYLVQYTMSTPHTLSTVDLGGRIRLSLDTLIGGTAGLFYGIAIAPTATGSKLYVTNDEPGAERIHSFDLRKSLAFTQYGGAITDGNQLDGLIQQFDISTDGQVVAGTYSYVDMSSFPFIREYNFKIYRYNSSTNTWNTEFEYPTPPTTTSNYVTSYLTPDGLNCVFVENTGTYDIKLMTYSGGSWSTPTTIVSAPRFVYNLCLNNTADRLFFSYNSASGTVPYPVDVWDKSGGTWYITHTFNTYYSTDLVCDGTGDQVAFGNITNSSGRGTVYIYDFSSGTWTLSKTYTGGVTNSNLGAKLEMSDDGNTLIIGSPSYNVGGNSDRGQVDVYKRSGGTWGSTAYYTAQGTTNNQRLGIWVGLTRDGTRIAYGDDASPASVPIQVYDITGGSAVFEESINAHTDSGNISFRSPNYLLYAISGGSNNIIRTLTKIS